jgi:alkylhydroperoxidase/carboxymuconolactone decarboxylase family protein YurZ
MMMDWKAYRNDLLARIGDIGTLSPETLKGYRGLSAAGSQTGPLDDKTRELIALAAAVSARRKPRGAGGGARCRDCDRRRCVTGLLCANARGIRCEPGAEAERGLIR